MAVKEFGWIDINPCSRVRKLSEPRGRTRFLTDDERERLLASCEDSNTKELLIIVLLALSTGARKNEIRWLRWDDVNMQTETVIFRETKNGTIRSVPIVGRGLDLIREWGKIRRLDTDLVFPGKNPKHPVLFEKSWKRTLKDSDIEDFRFHDLRHSTASYLIMAGVHMRTVAEILGHRTLAMVQRYSHLSPEHLRGELTRTMESVNL
jgi:integrase